MELAFEQQRLTSLRRTAHPVLAQDQTQEIIIPDSMPDAARTLICYAEPELQSKTVRAGSLLVTGTLRTSCLYAAEDGSVQLLTAELPFAVKPEGPELTEAAQTAAAISVRSADSRLINSRKVLLRVNVLVQADGYEQEEQVQSVLTQAPACLQTKRETYARSVPVELAERAFQMSEELALPDGKPQIDRLVDVRVQPVVTDRNITGGKAVMKGNAEVRLTYLDAEGHVQTAQLSAPFSQYCPLQGDYDGGEALGVQLCVTGVQLEPVTDGASQKLLFGAGILAQCVVYAQQEVTALCDAYVTRGAFTPQWQEQTLTMRLDAQTLREPVRASFQKNAAAVLDCRVYADAQAIERTDGGVTVHVPLHADILYIDPDGAVQGESFRTELSCGTALSENGTCEAQLQLLPEGYAAAANGAIELHYDAVFFVQTFGAQTFRNLAGGTLDPAARTGAQRPSVIICRTGSAQELWTLAKRYGTTAHAIESANHLTQPEVEAGRLLLIPM